LAQVCHLKGELGGGESTTKSLSNARGGDKRTAIIVGKQAKEWGKNRTPKKEEPKTKKKVVEDGRQNKCRSV